MTPSQGYKTNAPTTATHVSPRTTASIIAASSPASEGCTSLQPSDPRPAFGAPSIACRSDEPSRPASRLTSQAERLPVCVAAWASEDQYLPVCVCFSRGCC